jgi:hypothetical protein
VPRSAPLVYVERRTVDVDNVPFELSHDLFLADRVRIVVRAQADRSTDGALSVGMTAIAVAPPAG